MAWHVGPSCKLRYPSGKQASLGNELRGLVKGEARGDDKGTLMAAYGHEYHVVEDLSEEHLLMRSLQADDWVIVVMVEFHATKKQDRKLHIRDIKLERRGSSKRTSN